MKKFFLAALLLLGNSFVLFADDPGTPCTDPDTPCPIDTWVIIFAALALIITTVHLYKKQEVAKKLSVNRGLLS